MAFKRTSFSKLSTKKNEYFASIYKFSKVTGFVEGMDVYVIPLGLETGYYETPCHAVNTHKVNGQTIGYNGSSFTIYIKCNGRDDEGNRQPSLCCELAQKCKEKYPDKNDYGKRVIGASSSRVQLPVLILGNSLAEKKPIYPVSKVSILNELKSSTGLKFAYIDMSTSTFEKDIVKAYGTKLKEEGILDYDLDDNSEDYLEEIRNKLTQTIIKVHGIPSKRPGIAMREYSFFPFSNPAIASQSPEGERQAIVGYRSNKEIMNKVTEFLTLFDTEVDNIIQPWDEKSLQEYFNSAMGLNLKGDTTPVNNETEQVEVLEPEAREFSNEEEELLNSSLSELNEEPVPNEVETSLEDFEYEENKEEEFFG